MPNNLSIKDGLGQPTTLKTVSGSNGHVPYHVIEEISGSAIASVTSSLLSISSSVDLSNTRLNNVSSSINSNLVILNATITGSNTLLTNLSSSTNSNLVNLSSSTNSNLVNLSSSINTNLVNLSSSVNTNLVNISSSVSSLGYATTGSSLMYSYTYLLEATQTNAKSIIVTNMTNGPLYIKLAGGSSPSRVDYTYVVPISGTYEALERNSRVRHAMTASDSTEGRYSYAYTT